MWLLTNFFCDIAFSSFIDFDEYRVPEARHGIQMKAPCFNIKVVFTLHKLLFLGCEKVFLKQKEAVIPPSPPKAKLS